MPSRADYVVKEEFKYSDSGSFIIRVIHLTNGNKISTRLPTDPSNSDGEDPKSAFDFAFLRMQNPPEQKICSKTIHTADLFSGCGGLSLGAMEACRALNKHFMPVFAVDNNPFSSCIYEGNFKPVEVCSSDIRKILDGCIGSELTENEATLFGKLGEVNLLLAGPPCQGYSSLNNYTRQSDERNSLYERVARFVEIIRPEHVLIENIPTVTCAKEKVVQKSIDLMWRLGYEVDSDIVDLAKIGIAQKRKRHVVVASSLKKLSVESVIQKFRVENGRSVMWAIGDIEDEDPDRIFTCPTKHSKENIERMKYLHENDLYDLPNWLRPPCHRKGKHGYKSMYGRMKADKPAQTITTGFLSPGQGRFIHPARLRTITPHEAARLQGFPDFFDFSKAPTRRSLSVMIGNAAPMKLAYVFCLELLA